MQTLVGGLSFGAIYALVALGFSIVYRTMGLVNFAHGDVVMIGAYIAVHRSSCPAGCRSRLAVLIAIALTGGHRPGHRAGAAPAGEQGLRPDAHRHDRLRHRAGGAGHPDLGRDRAARSRPRCRRAPLNIAGIRDPALRPPGHRGRPRRPLPVLWFLLRGPRRARRCRRSRRTTRPPPRSASTSGAATRSRSPSAPAWPRWPAVAGRPAAVRQPDHGRHARASRASPRRSWAASAASPAPSSAASPSACCPASRRGYFQGYSDLVTFVVFTMIVMIRPTGIFGEPTVNRA